MRESSFFTAVNLAIRGGVRPLITRLKDEGKTYDEIAAAITRETLIPVSREWVRKVHKSEAGTTPRDAAS